MSEEKFQRKGPQTKQKKRGGGEEKKKRKKERSHVNVMENKNENKL